jgi:hypothetical protein
MSKELVVNPITGKLDLVGLSDAMLLSILTQIVHIGASPPTDLYNGRLWIDTTMT